jgi:hypothetical protein
MVLAATAFWLTKAGPPHPTAGPQPRYGGPIIMPENGRENKAGPFATVTFRLTFGLKL